MRLSPRLLPLPFFIAISLSAQAADDPPVSYALCPVGDAVPVFAEAAGQTGTAALRSEQPTDIEGDTFAGKEGETTLVQGNVALTRGDQFIGTDKLTYDSEKETYVAEGSVRYQDEAMRIVAERAEGSQATDTHQIDTLKYQLVSRRGNGGADRIEMKGQQGTLYGSTYSTCDPSSREWELRARSITVDSEKGFAVARGATVRIGKVPVLYVPWVMFPIDERRRTGLLFPSIGNSDRNGFDYRQPIYLNLAPNYDATLNPRIMTNRGALLGGEFRYLNESGAGTVAGAYMPQDDLRDRERGHFVFNAYQNLTPQWQARANLIHISDPRYFEDFNSSSAGISYYSAASDLGVYGRGRYWNAGLSADHSELADYTLSEFFLPFDRLPRAYFNWERPFARFLSAGVESEAVRFQHPGEFTNPNGTRSPVPVRPGGTRVDLKPSVSMSLEGASWFIRPTLAYRYTGYRLDDALAGLLATSNGVQNVSTSQSRSLPIASLDAGLFFDRRFNWGGEGYMQTLEPRLYYLNIPYRNQDNLPIFDTQLLTFSWGQLFRDNRYSGADRQTDANQLTTALTTRFIRESDGFEKLSASIGQISYFEDARVVVPGELPIKKGKSAWIADANWSPSDRWTIGASYQYDPKARREDLLSVRARYLLKDDGVVNFAYRYRRNQAFRSDLPASTFNQSALIEQADFSFLYPINPTWSVVGRYYYSILDKKALETIAGVQWDSCCVAVRLVSRRYVQNREGDISNGVMLEIELKGLGSAGQDTRRTLRRAIQGYYRDDLYLVPPETATGTTVTDETASDPDPTP
ncbi:MAG: LPS-assembly protein LptD [Pseudomonadota bacterium]|nr:LPS-assembly protein LptD [Pseudomonadota bacterium]